MISYPLVIPGTIGASKANLKKFDAVSGDPSPFDGSTQLQQFQDQHWELDLEWPEMTWPQFAALDGFSGALHGKLGSFLWSPPLAAGPQGMGLLAGTPACTGADANLGSLLHTSAWLPNKSGVLLPGDFLGIAPNSLAIVALQVADDGFVSVQGTGIAPAWLVLGANVWIAGSGLADGGPFVLTAFDNLNPGWIISFANTSGFPLGYAYAGSVGSSATAAAVYSRLYQYVGTGPLNTDGGGNAAIDIFPCLREAPPAGTPLVLIRPQGTFRLAANLREAPAAKTKTFTFQMKCREAI